MPYAIGETVWHRGDPYVVSTLPYGLHGAEWQDARDESGDVITVATPEARAARDADARKVRDEMREGFTRLHR